MVVVYMTSGPSLRDPLHTQCRAQYSSYSASEDEATPPEQQAMPLEQQATPPEQQATPLERLYLDMRCDAQTVRELAAGRRVGFYEVRSEIGCGIFSCVKLGVHCLTKEKVAIKILDKTRLDPRSRQLLWREVGSMERLWHPNIVRLYEVLETPSRLHLVMELAPGGELQPHISAQGRLSDPHSKVVFSQIVAAVKHMHDHDIVHRDLKAENIFLSSSGLVKVGDFGFSICSRRDQLLDTFCGSPPYAAPELLRGERYVGAFVDVWALGVLLFFMVTGTLPFRADSVPRLRRLVLAGAYAVPAWLPGPCGRLIRGILRPRPTERWALDQMLGCEWLLPVEMPRRPASPRPDPLHLAAEPHALRGEEAEVWAALRDLGVTAEHVRDSQGGGSRSPITGLYRILQHRAHRKRYGEVPPVIMQLTSDPSVERLRAYRHTSKLCVIS